MLSFLRRRDLFSLKYSSSIIVRFNSTDSKTNSSFALSYLISTCGVTKDKAISAITRVPFESPKNPHVVINFLRENGFSNTQISKIIGKRPVLLLSSVDKTLKPKYDYFKSQGISGSDFAQLVCRCPHVWGTSLDKKIIPSFDFIRSIVHTDAKLLTVLKRWTNILTQDLQKDFIPNVALLRAQGVPADNIAKSLIAQPRSFMKPTSRFRDILEEVKKRKFNPSHYLFLLAVHGLTQMTKSTLKAKFDVYRRWGLSEEEVQFIFRKNPYCLMLSVKNIMSTMTYLVDEMGYNPSLIAKHPTGLTSSLTRRIIPRCSVIQILKTRGLVGNDRSLDAMLKMTEEVFLKKYVIKFEKEIPEVLTAYQGNGR